MAAALTIRQARRRARQTELGILLALALLAFETWRKAPPALKRWTAFAAVLAPLTLALLVVDFWPYFLAAGAVYVAVRVVRRRQRRRRLDAEANDALDVADDGEDRPPVVTWNEPPDDGGEDFDRWMTRLPKGGPR